MSVEILKSIKARLNRLKKIEEEHKRNTDDIIRQKQNDTQEKCPQEQAPEKITTTETDESVGNKVDSTEAKIPAQNDTDKSLDSICESLSQSKIGSKENHSNVENPAQVQSKQQENFILTDSIAQTNDSRLVEEDSSIDTSHVFTKENDYHFDGEWLSLSRNQAGIEPSCELFSQSFELSDNDGFTSIPDIVDQKLSHSTKGATFGIELPGETVTTGSNELRTSDLPKSATPKYQNYLVLNSEQDSKDETVTATDASFILPSISDFNLPPEPPKPFCHCREPTLDKISKKENENKDRTYYVCATNKCRFFRWGPKLRDGELIVEALKNAKVVKRIAKNPITNYFPKKKKIEKIISPEKIIEPNSCQQRDNTNVSKQDEIDREVAMGPQMKLQEEVAMGPDEILDLQPKSQENMIQNDLTHTWTNLEQDIGGKNTVERSTFEKNSPKISYPIQKTVLPDFNANLDMNIPSTIQQNDELMENDSIISDDSNEVNALDESIMTAGPGITKSQKLSKTKGINDDQKLSRIHNLLNTSTVDGFSPIHSIEDDDGDMTASENLDSHDTFDLSISSAPLFGTKSSTCENSRRRNHLQDRTNRMEETRNREHVDNPFNRANVRMRNNLNRAIKDSSSAFNALQKILKSQTDPAFLSKTAKFPSNYNTPFSM